MQSTRSGDNVKSYGLDGRGFDSRKGQGTFLYVRFEVFTAVTMKNGVFWDINPQFVLHRRHITSPQQSPAS
jgi:hypothetical protein